ncbi:MAG: hypothetical protein U1E02_25245 [Hydrogenophaga sp.]|nr:hypothetical protein [Hydrogenophaga sp.]
MKKQILLIATLLVGSQLCAETTAEKLIAFKEMKSAHRTDWMNFKQEMMKQRMDLRKKRCDEWMQMHKKHLQAFLAIQDASPATKEKLLADKLHDAVALYTKQKADKKERTDALRDKRKELCDKHAKDLAEFENTIKDTNDNKKEPKPALQVVPEEERTAPATPEEDDNTDDDEESEEDAE